MRVAITGATGTIGQSLVRELAARGDELTALSRDPAKVRRRLGADVGAAAWPRPRDEPPPADALAGRDAVVHLLGETIAQRWNDEVKREIRDSRVLSTRNLVDALASLPDAERPRVLSYAAGVSPSLRTACCSARSSATVLPPEPNGPWSFQRESFFAGQTSQMIAPITDSRSPNPRPSFSP
jgi:nucleoside-diphosphate-sugar epimerase